MSATVVTFPGQARPRRRRERRKYEQPVFKSSASIIDASEEDLLRDVNRERQKALNKLARINTRIQCRLRWPASLKR